MGAVERHRYQTELILLISIACKPATAIAREHLVSIAWIDNGLKGSDI